MQMKMSILTALFFVRHQGGTEAMDDFFTFAKKYIEQQDQTYVYNSELAQSLLVSPESLNSLLSTNAEIVKETVQRLLAASERISPQKLFSTEAKGFSDDLQYLQLRRVLVRTVEQTDGELREMAIRLLLRWGLIRASSEDLLLAA